MRNPLHITICNIYLHPFATLHFFCRCNNHAFDDLLAAFQADVDHLFRNGYSDIQKLAAEFINFFVTHIICLCQKALHRLHRFLRRFARCGRGFFLAFALTVIVSIPLSMWSARRAGGRADALFTALNQFFMAVPPFFTGLLFTWVFSLTLGWFVHGKFPGFDQDVPGSLWYLLFPAMALALPRIAMTVRMLRSTILSEMNKDYVRTAISRGNDWNMVLRRHVLKNSLVPVVTFLAQTMAEIVAGSIVVEQVFAVPGLGRLLMASISNRDYPVVQVIVVILALWVVLAGTLADVINRRIDPRLNLGGDAQ